MKTKQLTSNAMLAAMCAALGYVAIDLGNIKITFEGVPVLLAALMFGPIDGMLVGGIGTLIYQLLRYGVTATTPLWILPYVASGLLVGVWAAKRHFDVGLRTTMSPRLRTEIVAAVAAAEFMIFVLNTFSLYVDSHIYGYYSPAFIFGAVGIRLVICALKSVVFGLALPELAAAIRKASRFTAG